MSPSAIEPASASCSVAIVRINVDLPAPFGPSSPNMPVGIVSETSCSALTPFGYVLDRPSMRSSSMPSPFRMIWIATVLREKTGKVVAVILRLEAGAAGVDAGGRKNLRVRGYRPMLERPLTYAQSSPDGDTDGSRWSRAKRETTGSTCGTRIDPGGVADQIPNGVNSLRDRCRGRKIGPIRNPVVSRFARDHRLPYVTPAASIRTRLRLCAFGSSGRQLRRRGQCDPRDFVDEMERIDRLGEICVEAAAAVGGGWECRQRHDFEIVPVGELTQRARERVAVHVRHGDVGQNHVRTMLIDGLDSRGGAIEHHEVGTGGATQGRDHLPRFL